MLRLIMTGCCVACVVLVARRPPVRVIVEQAPSVVCSLARPEPALAVVDVAPSVAASSVARLVSLAAGEWIAEVNDQRAHSAFEAASLISAFAEHGGYLDVTVARRGGSRRVLVLVH